MEIFRLTDLELEETIEELEKELRLRYIRAFLTSLQLDMTNGGLYEALKNPTSLRQASSYWFFPNNHQGLAQLISYRFSEEDPHRPAPEKDICDYFEGFGGYCGNCLHSIQKHKVKDTFPPTVIDLIKSCIHNGVLVKKSF